jgi:hypothetical protein
MIAVAVVARITEEAYTPAAKQVVRQPLRFFYFISSYRATPLIRRRAQIIYFSNFSKIVYRAPLSHREQPRECTAHRKGLRDPCDE